MCGGIWGNRVGKVYRVFGETGVEEGIWKVQMGRRVRSYLERLERVLAFGGNGGRGVKILFGENG
jgi:hypothetical protein